MTVLSRYFQNFSRWVKRGHAAPLPLEPIPVESWAARKANYDRAQRSHHGRGDAYAHLRKATNSALIEQIFADEAKCLGMIDSHPWIFRDPGAVSAAIKAVARKRVAEARR